MRPFIITTLFIASLMLAACETPLSRELNTSPEEAAQKTVNWPRRALTTQEKTAIQKSITASLKDPTSPMFKWQKLVRNPQLAFDIYCGEVNAKNTFGGYVGFVPYQVYLYHNTPSVSVQVIGIGEGGYGGDTFAIIRGCANKGYLFN